MVTGRHWLLQGRGSVRPTLATKDYKRMRVEVLRQKLDKESLDVDGSRETLVSRLEQSDGRPQQVGGEDDVDSVLSVTP